MKRKLIYIPIAIGLICVVASLFVRDIGSLWDYGLKAIGFLIFGLFMLAGGIGVALAKTAKKAGEVMIVVLIGIFFSVMGGWNFAKIAMDLSQGPVTMKLNNCVVQEQSSLRRMFHSYYVIGDSEEGSMRLTIDRDTYYDYYDEYDFDIEVVCWEHCRVIKEIQ